MRANKWLSQVAPGEPEQRAPSKSDPPARPGSLRDLSSRKDLGKPPGVEAAGSSEKEGSRKPLSLEAAAPPEKELRKPLLLEAAASQAQSNSDSKRGAASPPRASKTSPLSATRPVSAPSATKSSPYLGKFKAGEDEQVQPAVSVDQLQDSIRLMRAEVSQMGRGMRSLIRGELEESMKSLRLELTRMSSSMRSCIRSEFEQFINHFVIDETQTASKPSSTPENASWNTLRFEPRQLPEVRAVGEEEQSRMNGDQLGTQVEKRLGEDSPEISTYSVKPDLEEPLLAHNEDKAHSALKRSQTMPSGKPSSAPPRRVALSQHSWRHSDQHSVLNFSQERELIKKTLQEAQDEDTYNVENFYYTTGLWQRLARDGSLLSTISLFIVAANVLWIGVDEDINQADVLCKAPLVSQVVNNFFCAYFTLELLVHLLAFEDKTKAFRDPMFMFDMILVGFMVWETWIMVALYLVYDISASGNSGTQLFRMFRLFRLTRVQGIVRLSVSVPEFMILLKGMGAAMRSVAVVVVFLFFTIFIFGILFTELLKGTEPFTESFANVKAAMYTLLLQVLVGADGDFMNDLLGAGVAYYVIYILFLFASTFTLMNVLVGVLCDVISNTSSTEKDNIAAILLEHEIGRITQGLDRDGDGTISKVEFDKLIKDKQALKSLDRVGVDVVSFGGLSQYIFVGDRELTLNEFCHLMAQFRDSRVATVKDLVHTHKFMTMEFDARMNELKRLIGRTASTDEASGPSPPDEEALCM